MNIDDWIISMQGSIGGALGTLALLLLAMLGLGGALLLLLHPERNLRRGCFLLTAGVTGFNLLALLVRLGGPAVFLFPRWLLALLLALPAAFGVWLLASLPGSVWRREAWLLAALGAVGVYTLGSALCAPYSWDECVYQVALLRHYLAAGSAAVLPDNPYSAFPSLPQFVMLPGVRLGGLNLPRLLVWAGFLAIGGWSVLLLRRFGRWTAALLVAGAAVSPLVAGMGREVYQEVFIVLQLLAAASAVSLFRRRPLVLAGAAGFFAGMAAAVKLTAGGVSIAITVLLLGEVWLRNPGMRRRWWAPVGIFAAAALISMLPFYWRSFAATGNWFYPFGAVLTAPGSAAALVEEYHRQLGVLHYGLDGLPGLCLGWIFVAFDARLYDGFLAGWLFPLAVAGGAVGWFLRGRLAPARVRWLWIPLAAALAGYAFWNYSSQQSRFLLPFYFFALFFLGSALPFRRSRRAIALGLIVLATAVSFEYRQVRHYYLAWRSLELSRRQPTGFLELGTRDPEFLTVLDHIGRETPEGSRFLLLFDRRTLYFPRPVELGTPHFQERWFTPVPDTPQEVLASLRERRMDYVLLGSPRRNPDPLPGYEAENRRLAALLAELLRSGELEPVPIEGSGDNRLLKVRH